MTSWLSSAMQVLRRQAIQVPRKPVISFGHNGTRLRTSCVRYLWLRVRTRTARYASLLSGCHVMYLSPYFAGCHSVPLSIINNLSSFVTIWDLAQRQPKDNRLAVVFAADISVPTKGLARTGNGQHETKTGK